MHTRLVLAVAAAVLGLAGCAAKPEYEIAADPKFAEASTMARLHAAGSVIVGVPYDLPGLGLTENGEPPEGFTVEIGKILAGALGLTPESITWQAVEPSTLKTQLAEETVDVAITTYSRQQAKKEGVGIAGSYYLAGQDLLVRDDAKANEPGDLAGQRVCTTGSAAVNRLVNSFPAVSAVTEPTWDHCVARLLSGSAEAVTGDAPLLLHYVSERADALRLLERPFTRDDYVVAVRPGDDAFGAFIAEVLEAARADGAWHAAYERTLGKSGLEPMTADTWPPPTPALDRRKIGRPR